MGSSLCPNINYRNQNRGIKSKYEFIQSSISYAVSRGRSQTVRSESGGRFERPTIYTQKIQPGTPVELPRGEGFWYYGNSHLMANETPIYGQTFTMRRSRIGGPGLVLRTRDQHQQGLQPILVNQSSPLPGLPHRRLETHSYVRIEKDQEQSGWVNPNDVRFSTALVMYGDKQPRETSLVGLTVGGMIVEDTEFDVIGETVGEGNSDTKNVHGMVHVGSMMKSDQFNHHHEHKTKKHPRRTLAIRFTCNLCDEHTFATVNPLAWKSGSVFAKCQGCGVVHKLKDHLRIFHEMAGPIFPPRDIRHTIPEVREALDRIAAKREGLENPME